MFPIRTRKWRINRPQFIKDVLCYPAEISIAVNSLDQREKSERMAHMFMLVFWRASSGISITFTEHSVRNARKKRFFAPIRLPLHARSSGLARAYRTDFHLRAPAYDLPNRFFALSPRITFPPLDRAIPRWRGRKPAGGERRSWKQK